ncbi:transposase [Paenibacillaceae bacterium T2]|uniref:Transposase n=1 Tax=Ferviditalea candida TaxID=3108399 RepID=A0ABU5ZKE0_9BACL|nr:transposase [Paenibacillaceae bacterium T2]
MKQQLGYIGLYMRRPAIAVSRIEAYDGGTVTFRYRLNVVQNFDAMDDGDPTVPPQFSCEECGGEMYPEYYKGVHMNTT